jgi:hypothetical protein
MPKGTVAIDKIEYASYRRIGVDTLHMVFPASINLERDAQTWVEHILRLTGENWMPRVLRSAGKVVLVEKGIKDELKLGLHVSILPLRIEVQFKGFWWLFKDAFLRCKCFCEELNALTAQEYYATEIHLRMDFFDVSDVRQVMPVPSSKTWYSFDDQKGVQRYYVTEGKKEILKSMLVGNSRSAIRVYRKDLENREQSNAIKKAIFKKVLQGRKMVRVETRLSSDACKIGTYKFQKTDDEEVFVRDTLGSWALKHSIRKRPRKWRSTPPRCWPLWNRFEEMFFRRNPGNVKWKALTEEISLRRFTGIIPKCKPYSAAINFVAKLKRLGLAMPEILELVREAENHADDRVESWKTSRNMTIHFLNAVRRNRKTKVNRSIRQPSVASPAPARTGARR